MVIGYTVIRNTTSKKNLCTIHPQSILYGIFHSVKFVKLIFQEHDQELKTSVFVFHSNKYIKSIRFSMPFVDILIFFDSFNSNSETHHQHTVWIHIDFLVFIFHLMEFQCFSIHDSRMFFSFLHLKTTIHLHIIKFNFHFVYLTFYAFAIIIKKTEFNCGL